MSPLLSFGARYSLMQIENKVFDSKIIDISQLPFMENLQGLLTYMPHLVS